MIKKIKELFKFKKKSFDSNELKPVDFKKQKSNIKKIKIKKIKFIWIKQKIKLNKEKIIFIKTLLIYCVSYGIIINYMLYGIFGVKFGIFTFTSYGILFHFLKEELPIVFRRFFSK